MGKSVSLLVILFFAQLTLITSVQAQKKKKKEKEDENISVVEGLVENTEQISFDQAEYLFSEGMKHFILEDYKKALILFEESDRLKENNPTTLYKIADTNFKLESYEEALKFAKKAVELDPKNQYFYVLISEIHRQNKDYEALAATLEKLTDVSPSEENYYNLASAYLYIPDYDKAIAAYNKSEDKFGVSELIIRQKQRVFLKLGKTDEALTEGEKLVEAYPGESRFITSQAQLLLANNKIDEASVLLEQVVETHPEDEEAKLMLARVYKVQGKDEVADKMIEETFSSNLVDVDQKIEILRMYQQEAVKNNSTERIKDLAAILVETHPNSAVAKNLYGDFLLFEQNKEEARKIFLEALEIDGDAFDTWQKVLNIDWELQDYEAVIGHAEDAQEFFPNQPRLYFFSGLGYVMKKDYEMAREMLESGKMFANNPQLVAQFDAQLGDVYHYLEEYDKSDEYYEKALDYDAENIQVLNNYAYYLSIRKVKLDKAMEMGKKLINKEPSNPTYLDTYGWILYANGKYKDALSYLEKAASISEDGTIAEHYGDVLYKTGNKEKAMEQWKIALENGGTENEDLLKKKIASGALIE
ncbi:MAG: hypothetical protein CMO01_01025 [Thalassobius sp.]|nr:hypothetical protein [Thalassovita sp.]